VEIERWIRKVEVMANKSGENAGSVSGKGRMVRQGS